MLKSWSHYVKMLSKPLKKDGHFATANKKIIHINDQHEINFGPSTLVSQLTKRNDAYVLKFSQSEEGKRAYNQSDPNAHKASDESLKKLINLVKALKKTRKLDICCDWCKKMDDEGLKTFGYVLKRLNSLQSMNLSFQW